MPHKAPSSTNIWIFTRVTAMPVRIETRSPPPIARTSRPKIVNLKMAQATTARARPISTVCGMPKLMLEIGVEETVVAYLHRGALGGIEDEATVDDLGSQRRDEGRDLADRQQQTVEAPAERADQDRGDDRERTERVRRQGRHERRHGDDRAHRNIDRTSHDDEACAERGDKQHGPLFEDGRQIAEGQETRRHDREDDDQYQQEDGREAATQRFDPGTLPAAFLSGRGPGGRVWFHRFTHACLKSCTARCHAPRPSQASRTRARPCPAEEPGDDPPCR